MVFPTGKVSPKILEQIVFNNLGAKHDEVIIGPSRGLDGAVIKVDDKYLITSMDPITGALKKIGWLAVNINANDIATFGVKPRFFSSCILLPENVSKEAIEKICNQINTAAKKLNIAITGGHSEITPKLPFPIIIGCCMGIADGRKFVTAQDAKAGDKLVLTKSAGLEGTAILAIERYAQLLRKVEKKTLKKAEGFLKQISIVKEAILAFKTGYVTAMHDPTEGGIAGGIHELADASKIGFEVYEEKIAIASETQKICDFYQIDPLQLIASGSLVIAVKGNYDEKIVEVLQKNNIKASVIGETLSSPERRVIIRKGGEVEKLVRPISDHLWPALSNDRLQGLRIR